MLVRFGPVVSVAVWASLATSERLGAIGIAVCDTVRSDFAARLSNRARFAVCSVRDSTAAHAGTQYRSVRAPAGRSDHSDADGAANVCPVPYVHTIEVLFRGL